MEWQYLAVNGGVLAVLAVMGIEDIRYRSIRVTWLVAVLAAACVYRLCNLSWETEIDSIIVGIIIIAGVSIYCRCTGSIGAADIVIMAFLGLMKGVRFALVSSMYAFALAAAVLVIGAVRAKMARSGVCALGKAAKSSIPLIPFLGIGALGVMICA